MKKLVVLFFFIFGIFTLVSAQSSLPHGYYKFDQKATLVSCFDGDKPLLKDMMVEVTEIMSNGIQTISDPRKAYRGETRKIFLKRIHKEDFISVRKSFSVMDSLMKEVYLEDHPVKKEIKELKHKDNSGIMIILFLLMFLFAMLTITKRH